MVSFQIKELLQNQNSIFFLILKISWIVLIYGSCTEKLNLLLTISLKLI